MKRIILMISIIGFYHSALAQTQEVQQLLLNVEKLAQLKSILNNMYKGYEVLAKGYNTIKDISQGNFKLHEGFLDGLLAVNPVVKKYKRVADILSYQQKIMQEQKKAFHFFKETGRFTPEEISYLGSLYNNLIQQSLKNLDALMMVITASELRMSDDERLQAIDRIFADAEDQLSFLRSFNNSTKVLAVQRMHDQSEVELLKRLHGVK